MAVATRQNRSVTNRVHTILAALHAAFLGLFTPDGDARTLRVAQNFGAKAIGKGLATVAITVVILNQLLTISVINNSTGPFSGVITSLNNIGVAALTLVVLGFLVLGGSIAMQFMDRF